MKLDFITTNPTNLRNDIIKMVEDGELKTWEIFTHESRKYLKHIGQWGEKGVIDLTPVDLNKKLEAKVIKFQNVEVDVKDFEGYYYGRFCEIIFVYFPSEFNSILKK
ncbi:hypothetical protein [Flavobacterium sp. I3-2]|uniref:hypothetical protein n=1 Tax=Flavobacterium sp. I3-2 TaxID=2748319 RepID=UPI0015AC47DF|nr:hypothetical protein [Flavobacterium sp. I3-2]